jgi:hypothetical protein
LNGHRLEIKNAHKILGRDQVRANASKRINLLKRLAGMNLVLSALEFGNAAYKTARDGQLKQLEPVHNKGLRIAIGAFCVYRTENILCESGFESLAERRRRKTINTAIQVVENESHPVNEWFREEEAFDNYALNMKLTKPFIIRALEACATLYVDMNLNMVEKARREEHPPWIGKNMVNIITRMIAVLKGAGTARIKA